MKKIIQSKKADDVAYEEIIFLIINIAFFCLMLLFAYRVGSTDSIKEENYAKSLALIIDSMKPGTEINIPIGDLYDIFEKNKVSGNIVYVNIDSGEINVKLMPGPGYSFYSFNKIKEASVSSSGKVLIIKT